jgi:hypothetical protein
MKAYTLLAAVLLAFINPLAFSAEGGGMTHHPDMKGGASMAEMSAHMDQMQSHLKAMRKEMAEIAQIKDPDEREARLRKHLQEMAKMMKGMRDLTPVMTPAETKAHLAMVERRVDLLQELVDQILQRDVIAEGTFPKTHE